MGACFEVVTLPPLTEFSLKTRVEEIRREHIRASGCEYSGQWGSKADGVTIVKNKVFSSLSEATDYIQNTNDKWDCVTAVRYAHVLPDTTTIERLKELNARIADTKEQEYACQTTILTRVKSGKSTFRKCKHCGSSIAVSYLNTVCCPVCRKDFLSTASDVKRVEKLRLKAQQLIEQSRQLEASAPPTETEVRWLVGGWCPS